MTKLTKLFGYSLCATFVITDADSERAQFKDFVFIGGGNILCKNECTREHSH